MHTALRSAGHPATMMGNVAFVAQNDSPAPPRRFLPWFHLVARLVLQPVRVMHLERTISVAARFALSSAQACGEVVRTLREARADRDFIDNGVIPCLHRSEEHTSELQSLMRISYAVFCLKKTNNQ